MVTRKWLVTALALALFAGHASTAHAGATIVESKVRGKPVVVMENRFVRLVFDPAKGGECVDFVYKPAGKRVFMREAGCVLGNRVWNYADGTLYMQWQKSAWDWEIRRLAGEVRLEMSCVGKVDFTRRTKMVKGVTLRDGEAMVRATQGFNVGQELMKPRKIGLWFRNRLGVVGERSVIRIPLDDGIATVAVDAPGASWFYSPSRGWAAVVGRSGVGLCLNMEYKRLMCFYVHPGRNATLEWAFRTMDIKNGDTFTTEELLTPFAGLKTVDGSARGVVAMFDAPVKWSAAQAAKGLAIGARLTSGVSRSGTLSVTLRPLPKGREIPVYQGKIALAPGKVSEARFTARAPSEGTWLLEGKLTDARGEVMDFVRPVTVGKAGAPVRIAPKEERLGRKTERFRDRTPLAGAAAKELPYTLATESPHVPWARPYAGGKLKALIVNMILTGRDAAELAQRLDMDVQWVTAPSTNQRRSQLGNLSLKRALEGGSFDVIIIGGIQGKLFEPDTIQLLRKRVTEGAGLVYVAPNRGRADLYAFLPVQKERGRGRDGQWERRVEHFITTGVPFDALPRSDYMVYRAKGDTLAAVGRWPIVAAQDGPGKGRVVVLSYGVGWQGSGGYSSGMTPFLYRPNCHFDYWEYYYSLLAKAAVWSARKEAAVGLKAITARAAADAVDITMRLDNKGAATPATAEARIVNAYGDVLARDSKRISIAPGAQDVRIPLKVALTDGLSLADVIVRRGDGKVLTWGSASLRVKRPVAVGAITFDKRAYYTGDEVNVEVELEPSDDTARAAALKAELKDTNGRVLARWSRRVNVAGPKTVQLKTKLARPLATSATLIARAEVDGRPSGLGEKDVFTFSPKFARREWGDYEHIIWGNAAGSYCREWLARVRSSMYRKAGMTAVVTGARWLNPREYEWTVRAGFRVMPMGVACGALSVRKDLILKQRKAYQSSRDKKHLIRPVCLNDLESLTLNKTRLKALAKYMGWLEPLGYNLGDEMSVTNHTMTFDYDFSPKALAAFRVWLKGQYGSREALNRQWDTKFKTWAEVMPMTAWEVKDRGNYSPWADHREFMDVSFSGFFKWTRNKLRQLDPKATVGMSGSQSACACNGYDWRRLSNAMDFCQNYTHHNTIMMQRSLNPKLHLAPWWGYRRKDPYVRWFLWRGLLQGNYGASYFSLYSFFNPDMTFSETTRLGAPIIREFQAGLARLLKSCERRPDIGIHYSQPSIRGSHVTGASGLFMADREGWVQALRNAGFQSEFMAADQLEAGELDRRDYGAFILPYSVAMSSGEAAALRRYVERGGLLIADAKTGLMDEHCKTLKKGGLDSLFGVTRAADPLASSREGRVEFTRDMGGCKLKGLAFDASVAEPALKLAGGTALGSHAGAPVAVVRRSGKGAAVYLNMFMDAFPTRQRLGIGAPMQRMSDALLALGGVSAPVRVKTEPAANTMRMRYRNGDAIYSAIQMERGKDDPKWSPRADITFPKTGFVYDVRKRKLVGRTNTVTTSIPAGDAVVYAILPYRVAGVAVKSRAARVAPGAPIRYDVAVRARGGRPGMHVVIVEAIGPDGKPRERYTAKLVTRDGKATGEILTALNDTPGRWTIRATDYVSSVSGDGSVDLGP